MEGSEAGLGASAADAAASFSVEEAASATVDGAAATMDDGRHGGDDDGDRRRPTTPSLLAAASSSSSSSSSFPPSGDDPGRNSSGETTMAGAGAGAGVGGSVVPPRGGGGDDGPTSAAAGDDDVAEERKDDAAAAASPSSAPEPTTIRPETTPHGSTTAAAADEVAGAAGGDGDVDHASSAAPSSAASGEESSAEVANGPGGPGGDRLGDEGEVDDDVMDDDEGKDGRSTASPAGDAAAVEECPALDDSMMVMEAADAAGDSSPGGSSSAVASANEGGGGTGRAAISRSDDFWAAAAVDDAAIDATMEAGVDGGGGPDPSTADVDVDVDVGHVDVDEKEVCGSNGSDEGGAGAEESSEGAAAAAAEAFPSAMTDEGTAANGDVDDEGGGSGESTEDDNGDGDVVMSEEGATDGAAVTVDIDEAATIEHVGVAGSAEKEDRREGEGEGAASFVAGKNRVSESSTAPRSAASDAEGTRGEEVAPVEEGVGSAGGGSDQEDAGRGPDGGGRLGETKEEAESSEGASEAATPVVPAETVTMGATADEDGGDGDPGRLAMSKDDASGTAAAPMDADPAAAIDDGGDPGETKEAGSSEGASEAVAPSEAATPSVPAETVAMGETGNDNDGDEDSGLHEDGDSTSKDDATGTAAAPMDTDPAAAVDDGDASSSDSSSSESDSDDSSSSSSEEDEDEDEETLDLPDSPSHEGLSDYELLRLRKMARNRARLAKLGLVSGIVGSSFGATTTTVTTPSSTAALEGGGPTWVCTRLSCGRENPTTKMRCLYCHGWRNGVRNPAIAASASSRRSEDRPERRQLPARRSRGVSLLGNERQPNGGNDKIELGSRRRRLPRCHSCDGCLREDCGTCPCCLDKPRFGGTYRLRQACQLRVCRRMLAWKDRNDEKFYLRRKVGDTVQTPYGVGTVLRVVGEEEEEEEVRGGKATKITTAAAVAGAAEPDGEVSSSVDAATLKPTSATMESPAATTDADGGDPGDDSTRTDAQLPGVPGAGITPIASNSPTSNSTAKSNAAATSEPEALPPTMTAETSSMARALQSSAPSAEGGTAAPVIQPTTVMERTTTTPTPPTTAVTIESSPAATQRTEAMELTVDLQPTAAATRPIPPMTESAASLLTCAADPIEETGRAAGIATGKVATEESTATAPPIVEAVEVTTGSNTSPTAQQNTMEADIATETTDARGLDPVPTMPSATTTPTAAGKGEMKKKRTSMEITITSWTMSGGSHPTLYVPPIPTPEEKLEGKTPAVLSVVSLRGSCGRGQSQLTSTGGGAAPPLPANTGNVGPTWMCSHASCRAENPDNRKRCVSCLGWRGGIRWDLIGHRLVEGAEVRTLYGSGKIVVVGTAKDFPAETGTVERKTEEGVDDDADVIKNEADGGDRGEDEQRQRQTAVSSMAVSLTSWTMADGSHPTLYLPSKEAIENSIVLEGRASRTFLSAADTGGPTWTCCNPTCQYENAMSKKRCGSCQGWRGGTRDMRTWASLCANCGIDGAQVRCKKCDQSFHLTCHDPPLNNGIPRGSWKCGECKKTPYSSQGNCSVCSDGGDVVRCKRCDKLYHLWCHFPPLESIPRGSWKCTACKKALGAFKFGSAADDSCSVCGEVGEGADLVNCKICNKGFHRACHDPPLNGVHRGKWKCETCKHLPPPKKARPPAPRYVPPPEDIHNADDCYVCFNGGELICCDYCDKSFHLDCHIPALPEVPRGRWKCMECYAVSRKKKSRCGECRACRREDCGNCVFCLDKPKFGGSNKLKKPCEKRACPYQNFAAMAPVATPAASRKPTSETKKWHLSVPQAMPVFPPAKKRKRQAMPVSPPAKKRKRSNAPKAAAEAETSTHPGTSTDDTVEDAPIDVPKPGFACYSFELYSTLDNETPELIAPKLGCTWQEIVAENRERYGYFKLHSRFQEGTILRIPLTHDKEKVAKIAEVGPQIDGKAEICRECGVLEVEAEGGVSMLSCEMCGGSCHLACAHDKPSEVPQVSWFCQCCAVPKLRVTISSDETGALIGNIITPDLGIDEDGGNSDDEIRYEAVPEPGFVCSDAAFYCTLKNDTAERIAPKLGCTWEELASENIDRYGKFTLTSRFKEGTLLRIPSSHDKDQVEMLKRREDRIDVCCECGVQEGQQGPAESPMMLCDGCDAACHLACTPDHLSTVPEGEWFCRSCAAPKIRVHVQSGRGGKITATIITTCEDDNISEVQDSDNVPMDDMPDPGFVCPDAIFYSTRNNDTPELLAPKFGCSWRDLVSENNQYGNVRRKSKFKERTLLRIPSSHDREKVEKLKQREDRIDTCCECGVGEGQNGASNSPLLLCDNCDAACHLSCTPNKLRTVPDGYWFCRTCAEKKKSPGSRKGPQSTRRRGTGDGGKDNIDVDNGYNDCNFGTPKRKRGRPRKQDNIEVDKGVDDCDFGTPKRKRGRPRKQDNIEVDKGVDDCNLRPTKRPRASPRRQGNVEVDTGVGDCNLSPTTRLRASPRGQQSQ